MATRLVFAGRWTEKRHNFTFVCMSITSSSMQLHFKSCAMWMYWHQYLQWFYSDNAVYLKQHNLTLKALIHWINEDLEIINFLSNA